jgi:plasmid stabilization system protein ParE
MKIYAVVVSATAKANMRDGYRWAARNAPEAAAKWLERFYHALQSLATYPERCGVAPEAALMGREIRQLLFGRRRSVWRALFVIEGQEVRVLHVRRGTRDVASLEELGDWPDDEPKP